jgi:hypothetical protein
MTRERPASKVRDEPHGQRFAAPKSVERDALQK